MSLGAGDLLGIFGFGNDRHQSRLTGGRWAGLWVPC